MSTSLVLSAAYLSLSLSLFLTLPPSAWLRIQDRVKERREIRMSERDERSRKGEAGRGCEIEKRS